MNKKTNKTAHVLKLLTNSEFSTKENPILNEEFKDEMILNRSGSDRKTEKNDTVKNNQTQQANSLGINIISEIIQENLPTVLERFRCCNCEKCRTHIAFTALNQIPPQYANTNDKNSSEVMRLKQKYKNGVVTVLVKIALQIKNNPIHN